MVKGVIYYTENCLDEKIAEACRKRLREVFPGEIVSCSLKPLGFADKEIVLPLERGYLTMFKQILAALEASSADVVYFCEHDVMYHPSHFEFTPPEDKFYYDLNWWKIRNDGLAVHWDAVQVSGLCCYRQTAINFYKERIESFDSNNFDRKFEPTQADKYETWRAEYPHIDIRHERNLTYNKWKLDHFRKKDTAVSFETSTIDKIPGWDAEQLKLLYL